MRTRYCLLTRQRWYSGDTKNMARALKRLLGDECVEELRAEAGASPAAGGTKKAAKVDRDAEIDALAKHVSKVTKKWIGKDKDPCRPQGHRGRLRLRRLSGRQAVRQRPDPLRRERPRPLR